MAYKMKTISFLTIWLFALAATAILPGSISADPIPGPTRPACPIQSAPDRIIVNFSGSEKLCSYLNPAGCASSNSPVAVNLAAGKYKVTLSSWDGYLGRTAISQPNEQWYASVVNASGELAASSVINDLADNVAAASLTQVVNDTPNFLTLASAATKVIGKHAFPGSADAVSANSVFPLCAAFDKIPAISPPPPALDGSCFTSPASVQIGSSVSWSATATGGAGTYTYSWSGDENLSGASTIVTRTYSSAGMKLGTVEITSGAQSVQRTCSASITPRTCETGCGGGLNQPNVVLYKKTTSSPLVSASIYLAQTPYTASAASASVFLSQIPYTGLRAEGMKAVFYTALLLAISGLLAYIAILKWRRKKRRRKETVFLRDITPIPRAIRQ